MRRKYSSMVACQVGFHSKVEVSKRSKYLWIFGNVKQPTESTNELEFTLCGAIKSRFCFGYITSTLNYKL